MSRPIRSHSRSQDQETTKEIVVGAYTPTTEEVRDNYDPSCAPRFADYFSRSQTFSSLEQPEDLWDAIRNEFDRWLRKVKAEAWREGHRAAWEASGDGWNGEVNGISSDYDELVRGGMFEDNPYESEEA